MKLNLGLLLLTLTTTCAADLTGAVNDCLKAAVSDSQSGTEKTMSDLYKCFSNALEATGKVNFEEAKVSNDVYFGFWSKFVVGSMKDLKIHLPPPVDVTSLSLGGFYDALNAKFGLSASDVAKAKSDLKSIREGLLDLPVDWIKSKGGFEKFKLFVDGLDSFAISSKTGLERLKTVLETLNVANTELQTIKKVEFNSKEMMMPVGLKEISSTVVLALDTLKRQRAKIDKAFETIIAECKKALEEGVNGGSLANTVSKIQVPIMAIRTARYYFSSDFKTKLYEQFQNISEVDSAMDQALVEVLPKAPLGDKFKKLVEEKRQTVKEIDAAITGFNAAATEIVIHAVNEDPEPKA